MSIINSITSLIQSFLPNALYIIPISLVSLSVHEFAHGFVAYKLGDPTAKEQGRVTLNPIKHIDPIGLILMLLFRFGYAKPVPVNPMYFKSPKKGMLLTAAAGPVSNLILGIVCSLLTVIVFTVSLFFPHIPALVVLYNLFYIATVLNISLAVFNLIPVYPFDGSRILNYFMPTSFHRFMYNYGKYIGIAFFVLLLTTDLVESFVSMIQSFLTDSLIYLWQLPLEFILNLII